MPVWCRGVTCVGVVAAWRVVLTAYVGIEEKTPYYDDG